LDFDDLLVSLNTVVQQNFSGNSIHAVIFSKGAGLLLSLEFQLKTYEDNSI